MLARCEVSLVGNSGNERNAINNNVTRLMPPNTRNVEERPIGSISIPPNNGPATKPSNSTPASLPKRSPRRSGSTCEMSARTAGITRPNDEPMTARARTNCASEVLVAMSTAPSALTNKPSMISRLACPRSAYGAMNNCMINPLKNPAPEIKPRLEVAKPNLS